MARGKSDDEKKEGRPHSLTPERPGVYVQVVSPRRRKGRSSAEDEAPLAEGRVTAVAEVVSSMQAQYLATAIDAEPKPSSAPTTGDSAQPAPDSERPSGERPIGSAAPASERWPSENSNGRLDLVVVSLPPPPRLPRFDAPGAGRYVEEDEAEDGPSILGTGGTRKAAAHETGAGRFQLFASIAALSVIIGSAGVIAWRGSSSTPDQGTAPTPAALVESSAAAPSAPELVADPTAPSAVAEAGAQAQASAVAPAEEPPSAAPSFAEARRVDPSPELKLAAGAGHGSQAGPNPSAQREAPIREPFTDPSAATPAAVDAPAGSAAPEVAATGLTTASADVPVAAAAPAGPPAASEAPTTDQPPAQDEVLPTRSAADAGPALPQNPYEES